MGAGRGWHTLELQRALETRGHRCALLPISGMRAQIVMPPPLSCRGVCLDEFDVVLVRIIPRGSLDQTIFRMDALHLLEARGVRVVNPARAIERTVDKFYTSGLLAQAGLPTPRTVVCERSDDALEAFAMLGADVVIKPLFGSMGLGMVRVEHEDLAYRVFKALEVERTVYYVQETIQHNGRDIRAFVLDGRVVTAMERVAGGWRTNVARGAKGHPLRLTEEQERLCLRAARVVGTAYAGVDLLEAREGELYVLEVNGVPGWQAIQSITRIDIAQEIVGYLETTARGLSEARGQTGKGAKETEEDGWSLPSAPLPPSRLPPTDPQPPTPNPQRVVAAVQLACLLEASAEKPGNVTPSRSFHNMDYGDFLRSAVAMGPELGRAGDRGVGATILAAIEATRRWTHANTNLGIVLLCAPLAKAALAGNTPGEGDLRATLRDVLSALTVEDARLAYAAIRLARPGGLEATVQHDIRDEPTVTLREAMASAAERDNIAAEYASDYTITFELGLPSLSAALSRGATPTEAVVQTYLELLAAIPDTLIARKWGPAAAADVSRAAAHTLAAGGVFSAAGERAIAELDARLRSDGTRLNPGTTADLVAATLFVALLEGVLV